MKKDTVTIGTQKITGLKNVNVLHEGNVNDRPRTVLYEGSAVIQNRVYEVSGHLDYSIIAESDQNDDEKSR